MIDHVLLMSLKEVEKYYFEFFKEFRLYEQRQKVMLHTVKLGNKLSNLIPTIQNDDNFLSNVNSINSTFEFLKQQFPKSSIHTQEKFITSSINFEQWAANHIEELNFQFNTSLKIHKLYFSEY